MLADVHIADGQGHVPVGAGEEQVGGGGPAGHRPCLGDVDAQLGAACGDALGVEVIPQSGEQPHIAVQQGHVVGDISAHTPQGHADLAWVGVPRHQGLIGPAPNVHVDSAHHHGVAGAAQHIALARQIALLGQVGDVHGHRGFAAACLFRQLLVGDHGVLGDIVQDLSLPLGHRHHLLRKIKSLNIT